MNNRHFFMRMSLSNLKLNKQTYIPFIFTSVFTAAMFYIIVSLSGNPNLENTLGGSALKSLLGLGTWVTGLFAFIFLFYTFSFLFKRRKKEIGIYNVLGMEKKHISRVIAGEILIVFLISIILGLVIGMLLDKLMFLIVAKIIGAKASMGFYVSVEGLVKTVLLLAAIFILIFLNSIRQVHFNNPIELLKGGNIGEREPKAKWILALLGIICVGIGYYISLTTDNIVTAMSTFLIAVVLVIVGTYMLFVAGSIAILKLLKKNKKYYYKSSHFISVSGMIYRMKQNGVGLANICIISTMILIMLASTCTLWVGVNETVDRLYPNDVQVTARLPQAKAEMLFDDLENQLKINDIKTENVLKYRSLEVDAEQKGNTFYTYGDNNVVDSNMRTLYFVTCDDYNRIMGTDINLLSDNQVMVSAPEKDYKGNSISINENSYQVIKIDNQNLKTVPEKGSIYPSQFVIVKNQQVMDKIKNNVENHGEGLLNDEWNYVCNANVTKEQGERIIDNINNNLSEEESYWVNCNFRNVSEEAIVGMYAGLMFVGIFLSILFLMTMVLIIYYKQISEGYDDRNRYRIMQNVGLDKREIKRSIRSQVMTVFFLPLIVACAHVAAAFPLIGRMLEGFGMMNIWLYVKVTLLALAVFAIFYAAVYTLTSKLYYKIVN